MFGHDTQFFGRVAKSLQINFRPQNEPREQIDEQKTAKSAGDKGGDGLHMQVAVDEIFDVECAAGGNDAFAADDSAIRHAHAGERLIAEHLTARIYHGLKVAYYAFFKQCIA